MEGSGKKLTRGYSRTQRSTRGKADYRRTRAQRANRAKLNRELLFKRGFSILFTNIKTGIYIYKLLEVNLISHFKRDSLIRESYFIE